MHNVTQLMEKGDHFLKWHQIWSIFNWRIKIHEKYCYFGIFALDLHSPRKLLRSISFHQIGVKIAQNSIFAFIFDLKALYRWMPHRSIFHLSDIKVKYFLLYLKHFFFDVFIYEIFLYLFLIHWILRMEKVIYHAEFIPGGHFGRFVGLLGVIHYNICLFFNDFICFEKHRVEELLDLEGCIQHVLLRL